MTITLEIPDELAGMLSTDGNDPSRAVLEAVALEGYRTDRLSEFDIQQLLGQDEKTVGDATGLANRAQDISAKFAAQHPKIEPALRNLGNILASVGI